MEKWRDIYTEKQLKTVQEIERKNLSVMTEVCEKLGIDFFAYGGTLIGAVRHKGFIPWDDDLDVALPRKDYMTFAKKAKEILPKEYYLQTPYEDKKSPFPYMKLRLKGTKYAEYGHSKLDIEQGVYIDIYPIDNLPSDFELFKKQHKKFQTLVKLFAIRQCPYLNNSKKTAKTRVKSVFKYIGSLFAKLIPHDYLVKKIDEVSTMYNNEQTGKFGNLYYPKPANCYNSIYPLVEGEFDGQKIMLQNDWENHLKSRYGNYLELPPEEKRCGHKPYDLKLPND